MHKAIEEADYFGEMCKKKTCALLFRFIHSLILLGSFHEMMCCVEANSGGVLFPWHF